MPRIRSVKYMIANLEDQLSDLGFTVFEGRGPRDADYWQCNECDQQAESLDGLPHEQDCSTAKIGEVLHEAWIKNMHEAWTERVESNGR